MQNCLFKSFFLLVVLFSLAKTASNHDENGGILQFFPSKPFIFSTPQKFLVPTRITRTSLPSKETTCQFLQVSFLDQPGEEPGCTSEDRASRMMASLQRL